MIEPKMEVSKYGKILQYTQKEIERVKEYSRNDYKYINSILTNNDGAFEQTPDFSDIMRNSPQSYATFVKSAIEAIPEIYSAMLKNSIINYNNKKSRVLHRGTTLAEAESLERGSMITSFKSASEKANAYEDGSGWQKFAYAHGDNACEMRILIEPDSNVLTITPEDMLEGDVLPDEYEVLIGPFTQVESKDRPAYQSDGMTSYSIKLKQAELKSLSKEEQATLEEQIESALEVDTNGHSKIFDAITLMIDGDRRIHFYENELSKRYALKADLEKRRESITSNDKLQNLGLFVNAFELIDDLDRWQNGGFINEVGLRNTLGKIANYKGKMEALLKEKYGENIPQNALVDGAQSLYEKLSEYTGDNHKTFNVDEVSNIILSSLVGLKGKVGMPFTAESYENAEREYRGGKRILDNCVDNLTDCDVKIKAYETELAELRQRMKEAKPTLSGWKKAIINLSMARCYDVEKGVEKEMQEYEERYAEQPKAEPNPDVSNKEEQKVASVQQDQNTGKEEEILYAKKSEFRNSLHRLGITLYPSTPEEKQKMTNLLDRSERLGQKIAQISGERYQGSVTTCRNLLNGTFSNCERINSQVMNASDPNMVSQMVDAFHSSLDHLKIENYQQFQTILQHSLTVDENLFKKVVFEKFCDIAIQTENDSMIEEKGEQTRRFSQKTFLGFGKAERLKAGIRADRLHEFLKYSLNLPPKEYKAQKYSVREIVAEMEVFI